VKVVQSREDFFTARGVLRGPVGLVPTMGALHAGHVALLDTARQECASVVTTNFVNPLQFGPGEDFARYPRTLDADLELCEQAGVDVVWAPTVDDVYPTGTTQVGLTPGPMGDVLEGVSRPGHFAGMLTVVCKFLNLVRPARSYYGEKDYQQLALIRQMVDDLELDVRIVGVPTVREDDGLARSSRNVYLSADDRVHALALSQALSAGRDAAAGGADAVLAAAHVRLDPEPGVAVDYLALRGVDLGEPPAHGPARLLVAARVGTTRLIDNLAVEL
jgi:pantoate--beta-alanine ligase